MINKILPEHYTIKRIHCICMRCNGCFYIDISNDDMLVKFYKDNGSTVAWIPLMGDNGYLDLLCKIVKGRNKLDPIDMKTVKAFEEGINKINDKNNTKYNLTVDKGYKICPLCTSKEITVYTEEILENPELLWLDIKL